MIHNLLFGSRSIALTRGGLDAGAARMRAISENVANVATPGYRAKEVQFEELIKAAASAIPMDQTDGQHISGSSQSAGKVPAPHLRATDDPRPEGAVNNVDIETEMVRMKQNEIHFQALSQLLARKYKGLDGAIR